MKELQVREVKEFVLGHVATKWQRLNLNTVACLFVLLCQTAPLPVHNTVAVLSSAAKQVMGRWVDGFTCTCACLVLASRAHPSQAGPAAAPLAAEYCG